VPQISHFFHHRPYKATMGGAGSLPVSCSYAGLHEQGTSSFKSLKALNGGSGKLLMKGGVGQEIVG